MDCIIIIFCIFKIIPDYISNCGNICVFEGCDLFCVYCVRDIGTYNIRIGRRQFDARIGKKAVDGPTIMRYNIFF